MPYTFVARAHALGILRTDTSYVAYLAFSGCWCSGSVVTSSALLMFLPRGHEQAAVCEQLTT